MNNRGHSLIQKDDLIRLYLNEKKPMHAIAEELDVAIGSVYKYCKLFGIPTRDQKSTFTSKGRKLSQDEKNNLSQKLRGRTRSEESRRKLSEAKKIGGIGHKKKRSDGYISIYFPDHPKSNKEGYVMEHDLIMECLIGRHLNDDEIVHHINKKRDDNRKENLKLMTNKEHMSFHMKERHDQRRNDLSTR